jgi:hypothetical protein
MHHLETLIQAIPPAVFNAGGPGVVSPSSDSASPLPPFIPHSYPSGVPPPSLHVFPLLNPSTHFPESKPGERQPSPNSAFRSLLGPHGSSSTDQLNGESSRMSLSAYLYFDDEGYTRWQGETSGLPLLDVLVERRNPPNHREQSPQTDASWSKNGNSADWFPNRIPRRADINPETLWRLITSYIVPEVMDRCVTSFRLPKNKYTDPQLN